MESKIIENKRNQLINLCIWDTAGQEKFFSLTKCTLNIKKLKKTYTKFKKLTEYFKKADGALITFDITDLESFKSKYYNIFVDNNNFPKEIENYWLE